MKKFLLAAFALLLAAPSWAADLPVKAPPPALAQAFNWTGFYVGGHVGGAFDQENTTFSGDPFIGRFLFVGFAQQGFFDPPLPGQLSRSSSSFMGGLQAGFNWQTGSVVLGLEADVSGLKLNHSSSPSVLDPPIHVFTLQYQDKLDWLATVRGRIGFTPTERLLLYGTGGVAFTRVEQTLTFAHTGGITNADDLFGSTVPGAPGGLVCLTFGGACLAGTASHIAVGPAAGAGLEYALTNNLTVRGEYLYANFGSQLVNAPNTLQPRPGFINSPLIFISATTQSQLHVARMGLNWKF